MVHFLTYILLSFVSGLHAGINDPFYIDIHGIKVNWTNPDDGWDEVARIGHLELNNHTRYQHELTPKLTLLGYKKMDIPQELYQMIIKDRLSSSNFSIESCIVNYNDAKEATPDFRPEYSKSIS